MYRTSNPALSDNVFQSAPAVDAQNAMTIQGTVNKTLILLFLTVGTALWSWGNPMALPLMIPAAIGGFIVAMVTVFKKEWCPVTAPIYALVEGVILGAMSS